MTGDEQHKKQPAAADGVKAKAAAERRTPRRSRAEQRAEKTMQKMRETAAQLSGALNNVLAAAAGESPLARLNLNPKDVDRMLLRAGKDYHAFYEAQTGLADAREADASQKIGRLLESLTEDENLDLSRTLELLNNSAPRTEVLSELQKAAAEAEEKKENL